MENLSEHYFGELEAFDEANLNSDFFSKTFVVPMSLSMSSLKNNKKFIIVGRKGAGKTAVQMHLSNDVKSKGYFVHHFRFFTTYVVMTTRRLQEPKMRYRLRA